MSAKDTKAHGPVKSFDVNCSGSVVEVSVETFDGKMFSLPVEFSNEAIADKARHSIANALDGQLIGKPVDFASDKVRSAFRDCYRNQAIGT